MTPEERAKNICDYWFSASVAGGDEERGLLETIASNNIREAQREAAEATIEYLLWAAGAITQEAIAFYEDKANRGGAIDEILGIEES